MTKNRITILKEEWIDLNNKTIESFERIRLETQAPLTDNREGKDMQAGAADTAGEKGMDEAEHT